MENKLAIIVKESGLEATKAAIILAKFQHYFEMASDWELKAKTIVVTREDQLDDMKMARTGRILLRDKRLAIEKARKDLKEQALREGKAIDGIANVLKALIVPIEEYLEKQEKFVEFKKAAEDEARRIAIEQKMEEERIAEEKRKLEEQERIRIENEKLKKEAEEREAKIIAERKAQELAMAKERAKADAECKALEDKARAEKAKADAEIKAMEDKAKADKLRAEVYKKKTEDMMAKEKAKLEAERLEKQRLQEMLSKMIKCPHCGKDFSLEK